MQKTLELIGNSGIVFQNAFVNCPICCPSRSSILTGKYAHNLGVKNNSLSGNCSSRYWQKNFETESIASLLKSARNYTTFYGGKYLNQYGSKNAGGIEHVPPGYDWWLGLKGNSRYYNYTLSINGSENYFGDVYLTDRLSSFASDFLDLNHEKHFFMMIAPPACHSPFTAANRHLSKFPKVKAVRNLSFNYSSYKKHWIVSMPPKYLPSDVSTLDSIQRKRMQSLLAVDDMVEHIVEKAKNLRIYHKTYFIFTSDNGYHIGQFGQPFDKRQPYETDIRVPLFISGPNIPRKKLNSYPVSSIDIAPTILDLLHIPIPTSMDGISFKKSFIHDNSFNKYILIEYWGEANQKNIDKSCPWTSNQLQECRSESWCKCQDSRNNTYSCVIHLTKMKHFKLCRFYDRLDFLEAYNLINDPFELWNIYEDLDRQEIIYYMNILHQLKHCIGDKCVNEILNHNQGKEGTDINIL
ncbi:hypothetical protein WA026_005309 [Henosepilachna vigintioctopunctata]